MSIYKKLAKIQATLKAHKGQWNDYSKFHFRNLEDILEALKPLLAEDELVLTLCDEMVLIGDRYYIKATATLTDGDTHISNTAYAREALVRKGFDESQITGATSSYARKYCLNGMFCIDDTRDADSTEVTIAEQICKCASVKELVALNKTLTPDEQNEYKEKFTTKKESLKP